MRKLQEKAVGVFVLIVLDQCRLIEERLLHDNGHLN